MLVLTLSPNVTWVDAIGPFGRRLRINRCEMPQTLDESRVIACEGEPIGWMVKLADGRGRRGPLYQAYDKVGFELPKCWRIIRSSLKPRKGVDAEGVRAADAGPAVRQAGVREVPGEAEHPAAEERDALLRGRREMCGDGGGGHRPLAARVARAASRGAGGGGGGGRC